MINGFALDDLRLKEAGGPSRHLIRPRGRVTKAEPVGTLAGEGTRAVIMPRLNPKSKR